MRKIWLYRWIFDPIHKWHYEYIENSLKEVAIDSLNIILKIIWEKDPIASLSQRLDMVKLQVNNNSKINVITHNILWHIQEVLNFSKNFWRENIIQICGSDKIEREIKVYWKSWDNFLVNNRKWFKIPNNVLDNKSVNLVVLYPNCFYSSTEIRKQLLINRDIKPKWLDKNVYNYILENDLYILNKNSILEFQKYWYDFIEYLNCSFQELQLYRTRIPMFNNLQHKDCWKDKFIRYIIKENNLSWDYLEKFFNIAYNFPY